MIVTCNGAMLQDPTLFPNPEEFRPERWLRVEGSDKQKKMQQVALSTFGHGPRNCLGQFVP